MLETTGTLDLISLELDLDFALDDLRHAVAGLQDAIHAADEVRARVARVQNRVVWSQGDVEENLRDLQTARRLLEGLRADTEQAARILDAYIEAWSRKSGSSRLPGRSLPEEAQGAA